MAISSLSAAKYLCGLSDWSLSNLQIQKILYIAHMAYLGEHDEPLIGDDHFQAWDYGPILPKLYRQLKPFGSSPIPDIFHFVKTFRDKEEKEKVESVLIWAYENLSKMSHGKLVAITHRGNGAWWNTYRPQGENLVISDKAIKKEFVERTRQAA